jgi:hypothetical protein
MVALMAKHYIYVRPIESLDFEGINDFANEKERIKKIKRARMLVF